MPDAAPAEGDGEEAVAKLGATRQLRQGTRKKYDGLDEAEKALDDEPPSPKKPRGGKRGRPSLSPAPKKFMACRICLFSLKRARWQSTMAPRYLRIVRRRLLAATVSPVWSMSPRSMRQCDTHFVRRVDSQ